MLFTKSIRVNNKKAFCHLLRLKYSLKVVRFPLSSQFQRQLLSSQGSIEPQEFQVKRARLEIQTLAN